MKTTKPFKYNNLANKQSDKEFERVLKQNNYNKLKRIWNKKLLKSGFTDQENIHGELKQPEKRSLAWANQDRIREFYLNLDEYLTKVESIPELHRQILEYYTQGVYIVKICKLVKRSRTTVKTVIAKYKRIILAQSPLG